VKGGDGFRATISYAMGWRAVARVRAA